MFKNRRLADLRGSAPMGTPMYEIQKILHSPFTLDRPQCKSESDRFLRIGVNQLSQWLKDNPEAPVEGVKQSLISLLALCP